MYRMAKITVFMLLVFILVLAGCSSSNNGGNASPNNGEGDSPNNGGEKPADSKPLTEVQLAVPHTSLFDVALPVYVGMEKGFYEEAGIKVETIFTKGGGSTVQGVIGGSVDIGLATGPQSVVAAYVGGAPLKIISAQMTGYEFFWVAKGDSTYNSLEDMAGKKIGFSSVGSSTHAAVKVMNEMLKEDNLAEMELLPLGSPPDQITAVLTDQVDAGFTTFPSGMKEINEGKIRIAIRGSDIEEYNDVAVRVNFANADFFEENPETVKAFLEAHEKAFDWIYANRDEAVALWKRVADLQEDEALLKEVFDFIPRERVRLAPLDGVDKIIEDSVTYDFIDNAPSEEQVNDLIDLQYTPVYKP